MRYRRFGRTGWNVSEIGYGMWGMGGWTGSEDSESLDSLQRAMDTVRSFLAKFCAPTKGSRELEAQTKNSTPQRKFRRRTAAGPRGANILSTIPTRRITSRSMSAKALRILASGPWI